METSAETPSTPTSLRPSDDLSSRIDLEGQFMAIEERWTVLCSWIGERWEKLTNVEEAWSVFDQREMSLSEWLDSVEKSLRQMERVPTEDPKELELQALVITVRQRTAFIS